MSLICIKNEDTKVTKMVAQKYLKVPFDTQDVKGSLKIIGYRKYKPKYGCSNGYSEVDIEFTGKYSVKTRRGVIWVDSEMYKNPSYSKIIMNRLLRKRIYKTLKDRAQFFSIDLNSYISIKKIKWT
jgi:hypothetical protein